MANILESDDKDLGGFTVSRTLPNREKKMVGPFVFFDHIGPANFPAGEGVNVRPHPHIGLATVTYLFEGSMLHRDSLGSVQEIHPGDVNWMIAGHGIVHSERETHEVRASSHRLHGLQLWIALPPEHEKTEPDFQHVNRNDLPCVYYENVMMRVIAGEAYGVSSSVKTFSPMFYVDVIAKSGAEISHPHPGYEAGLFIVDGALDIRGEQYSAGDFVLLDDNDDTILCQQAARFVLLGGEKFDRVPRLLWNFVAYDVETMNAAKQRWEAGEFPRIPGDDNEFIPLP